MAIEAQSLEGLLRRAAKTDAGVNFIDRNEKSARYDYKNLLSHARHVALALRQQGVRQGDCVAIILPTGLGFYVSFFAAQLLGAVAVPLYPPMRLGQLAAWSERTRAMLVASRAAIVISQAHILSGLAPVLIKMKLRLGQYAWRDGSRFIYDDAKAYDDDALASEGAIDPDALALLQFSSGTTQAPKPVALTHRQIVANIEAIAQTIYAQVPTPEGIGRHTALSWLPLYHDMGLIGALLTSLWDQTNLTLMSPEHFVAQPARWLRALSDSKATISCAPNFAYGLSATRIRDEELAGVDLSHWKMALNGAEQVQQKTMQQFVTRFAPYGFDPKALTPVWGLAEAALAVCFSKPTEAFVAKTFCVAGRQSTWVSVGQPLEGFEVQVVDAMGQCLKEGEVGELRLRGPSVMQGYYEQPEATGRVLAEDGWLMTGDLGLKSQNELFIVGRKKDIIIINGQNVMPEPLELAASEVDGVRRGCVIAVAINSHIATQHAMATEGVLLLCELKKGRGEDKERVSAQVMKAVQTATQITPAYVIMLPPGALPRTSSGKLQRQKALMMWQKQTLARQTNRLMPWWLGHVARLVSARCQQWWASSPSS